MGLTYDHSLYFDVTADSVLVETHRLHALKPACSQAASVVTARSRMEQAARGELPRRGPLRVRQNEAGGYDIIDGNATFAVAVEEAWPDLPVKIVSP